MISIENLAFSFGGPPIEFPDWSVGTGTRALVLGASGSGKTTLLHLLCGLRQPTRGSVWIEGTDLSSLSSAKLDRFRGQNIGIVFQQAHLIRSLTVLENIRLAIDLSGKKIGVGRVNEVLEFLELSSLVHRKPHQLSHGQAQRVAIARAVVHNPVMLAADEPTSALDDQNAASVVSLLEHTAEMTGATLVIATHDQRVKEEFPNALNL
jgi:putative ABC transport system ATP-binding protein